MATPNITLDQTPLGAGTAGVSRSDLVTGTLVTVADAANGSGVFTWTLVVPIGSATTLTSTSNPTTSFTPDIDGTYLVYVVVTGDASYTGTLGVDEKSTQGGAGVRHRNGVRALGVRETTQFDAASGYAGEMQATHAIVDAVAPAKGAALGTMFYTDANGDLAPIAVGTAGQHLESLGAAAPVWIADPHTARQTINIYDYCTDDTGTVDEYTGLQAAMDLSAVSGAPVDLGGGSWRFDTQLLMKDKCFVRDGTLRPSVADTGVFATNSCIRAYQDVDTYSTLTLENVIIHRVQFANKIGLQIERGLHVRMAGVTFNNWRSAGTLPWRLLGVQIGLFTDVHVAGYGSNAIEIGGLTSFTASTDCVFVGCNFTDGLDVGDSAVYCPSFSGAPGATGVVFYGGSIENAEGHALEMIDTRRCRFYHVRFEDVLAGYSAIVITNPSADPNTTMHSVVGCSFGSLDGVTASISIGANVYNTLIADNLFPSTPVFVDAGTDTRVIGNNTVADSPGAALDDAYNAGATITADAGAVAITNPNADAADVLQLATIAAATGAALQITNVGDGPAINISNGPIVTLDDVDAAGGYRRTLPTQYLSSPAISTTYTMKIDGSLAGVDALGWFVMPRAGSVVEISAWADADIAAGQIGFWVQSSTDGGDTWGDVWGSTGSPIMLLDSATNPETNQATIAKDTNTIAVGTVLRIQAVSDGSLTTARTIFASLGVEC